MNKTAILAVIVGATALVACASEGPASSGKTGASQGGSPAAASDDSKAIPTGYRRKVVGGQVLYCRNDLDTDSRVHRSEVCLTRDQLEEQQQNSRNVMQNKNQSGVL